MFYLAVVLEKGDVIGEPLQTEEEAELVVHLEAAWSKSRWIRLTLIGSARACRYDTIPWPRKRGPVRDARREVGGCP